MQGSDLYSNPGFQDSCPGEKPAPRDAPPPYIPGPPPPPGPQQGYGYPPYYPPYYPPAPSQGLQQPLICQPTTNVVVMNTQTTTTIRPRYNDYLCWSVLNLLCCCWPLGIAAVVFSCKTRSDMDQFDDLAAARSSRTAFYLNISALVIGLILNTLAAVLFFVSYNK